MKFRGWRSRICVECVHDCVCVCVWSSICNSWPFFSSFSVDLNLPQTDLVPSYALYYWATYPVIIYYFLKNKSISLLVGFKEFLFSTEEHLVAYFLTSEVPLGSSFQFCFDWHLMPSVGAFILLCSLCCQSQACHKHRGQILFWTDAWKLDISHNYAILIYLTTGHLEFHST